jgi:hypothetical protein
LEFSAYGASFRVGMRDGPKIPGRTASRSRPSAQSPREPSSTASPEDGYVTLPSGVEQRPARSSVMRGSTWDWVNRVWPRESAAIVFTHGSPCVRRREARTSSVPRARLKPRAVSEPRRLPALGSFTAYAADAVHGRGSDAPSEVTTGPYRVHHCVLVTGVPFFTATVTDRLVMRSRLPSSR